MLLYAPAAKWKLYLHQVTMYILEALKWKKCTTCKSLNCASTYPKNVSILLHSPHTRTSNSTSTRWLCWYTRLPQNCTALLWATRSCCWHTRSAHTSLSCHWPPGGALCLFTHSQKQGLSDCHCWMTSSLLQTSLYSAANWKLLFSASFSDLIL